MPELYILCDPVMGDDDELYVKQEIAEAIRDRLVPLAQRPDAQCLRSRLAEPDIESAISPTPQRAARLGRTRT